MANSRADLLIKLIKQNNSTSSEVFDVLVPEYDAELYTLFNIISRAKVSHSCKFLHHPAIDDGELAIRITLPKKQAFKCIEFISDNSNTFRYLKRHSFYITATQNSTLITLSFKRLSKRVE